MRIQEQHKKTGEDWGANKIRFALNEAGWNWSSLAKAAGYASSAALRAAAEKSYPKAERIIASAIGVPPETIWPSRYEKRNFTPVLSPSSPVCVPRRERLLTAAMG
ncbi:helix-turn-helix domain-containing protein [Burkholderia vietnamiensis]|uniref:helix-turn-helix domain-containing protein n=1 Tax=Burkholderia vietnamiensis TaxID=60552 RepID=UPI001CF3CB63|nr:helix-turn-helix domain-containing protein [Burkholderia vietnamiensis]MCA8194135.1 helix-turn-helix domain-containing protein [Burkholderia vietnamiensis]